MWFNIKSMIGGPLLFLCCHRKKLIVTASFQVTFEGIKGRLYQSDIAIDDVSIKDGSCPG